MPKVVPNQNEMQPVGYFVASLVFITMPPVFCMIGCLFLNLWNKELKKRNCREKLEAVLRAAIQAIVSPIAAVLITGAYLVLGENEAEEFENRMGNSFLNMNMGMVLFVKVFEILGESLPQLILTIVFISNNGGPMKHKINSASAVFSGGSVLYGLITSGGMWYHVICD